MRPCHICEKIVRLEKSITCSKCKGVFCFLCITKYFTEKASALLSKKENEPTPNLRTPECFACLQECKCLKCKSVQNVIYSINKQQPPISIISSLVNDQELIAQTGLFKGRKISELPLYLQRIYLKKKVLYSKHEISVLANDKNLPEQQNDLADDKIEKIQQQKQVKQGGQSFVQNNDEDEIMKGEEAEKQKEEDDEEEDIAEDYQSQFQNRRATHLRHNQNSGINEADVEDQNDAEDAEEHEEEERNQEMVDEREEIERKRRQKLVSQALQNQNNDSSIIEEVNQ